MLKRKSFEVMQYFKFYDTADINIIIDRVKSLSYLKKYALIVHDKDLTDKGLPKDKHFHIIMTFDNMTTSQVVANKLMVEEQYVNKIDKTTTSAFLYLVHYNDTDKYQYDYNEVYANFNYKKDVIDKTLHNFNLKNLANDIDNGVIKEYNLHRYITIEDYAKHKLFFDRCFQYRQMKVNGVDRKMECVFITGGSGVGKTTQAKMLASKKEYNVYISSGGKNPLDNYKGEECIILDDLRDTIYSLTDFLKLTDNNTNSLVGCRFYNKSIAECKMLIVTSCKPIEDYYKVVVESEKEPQLQLFRRFQTYIKMYPEYEDFYAYDDELKKYVFIAKCVNPVAMIFNKEFRERKTRELINLMGLQIVPDNKLVSSEDAEKLLQDIFKD